MYFTLSCIGLFIVFVIVTDLGPQNSTNRFWKAMQNARKVLDRICYIVITTAMVLSFGIALVMGIRNWVTGGGTSSLVTGAILMIIVAICFFSIRSTRESFRRGERCECCGDCSKCKIQCTTNEKYYGIQHREK